MKFFSTVLVMVALLAIGFLFLSSGVKNTDSNTSKHSVKKIQNDEYHSKFKRRDFIRERLENERRKEINKTKSVKQVASGKYHDDFMAFNRQDSNRYSHDDFK
ncbi:MAG: hypothetical protein GY775_00180 [Candidatus Scalindua sp.]|nr:hypothetical protein [Candidatus Scalindua sp.]